MEKITCTIEHITYQNPENGYAVLQASVKGYRENQTLVGTFHEVMVGAVLIVEGHVYAEREQLIAAAKTLLQAEEQPITETLNQMIAAEDVILDRIDSTEGGTLNIGLSAGIPMAAEDSPLMAADEILENFVKTGP